MAVIADLLRAVGGTAVDIAPVALLMLAFFTVVLRQELVNRRTLLLGLGCVIVGLALLLLGLEKALFPAGRLMVEQLTALGAVGGSGTAADWSSYAPVYAFAFMISFGAAMAEPALLAISLRVNEISGGSIRTGTLRTVAAFGVATGVALGCLRIAVGLPLYACLGAVYLVILGQTLFAPRSIVPLAYDIGAVSTTAVTVPVVTALGLGLAEQLPGRSALLDGFGLIALACSVPTVTVLAYAQIAWLLEQPRLREHVARFRGRGQ
jgi:hypothetical protein